MREVCVKRGYVKYVILAAALLGSAAVVSQLLSNSGNQSLSAKTQAEPTSPRSGSLQDRPKDRAHESTTVKTIVAHQTTQVPTDYSEIKSCHSYKRLKEFYASKMSDPSSPLGNPELFQKLPRDQQEFAKNVMQRRERDESRCSHWASSTDATQASLQIYAAARRAASNGDVDAMTCYALAGWQTPPEDHKEYKELGQNYREDVPRLLDRAIHQGHWRPIIALASNLGEQRGLSANTGLRPDQKYMIARLAELGASDSLKASQYALHAAEQSRHLKGDELNVVEMRANALYVEKFGRSRYERQDILDGCVN